MNALTLPEFLLLAIVVVAVLFGKNVPEFLQSLVLSKKQFEQRKSEVYKGTHVIDYVSELPSKREF